MRGFIGRFVTPRRQLCYLTTDPLRISEVCGHVEAFRLAWGRTGRAVSFLPESDDIRELPGVLSWRSALGADPVAAFRREAWQRYDRLIGLLTPESAAVLQDHRDEGVTLYCQALACHHLSENDTSPLFMIVPGLQADTDPYHGLKFGTRLFLPADSGRMLDMQQQAESSELILHFDQTAGEEERRDAHELVWARGTRRLNGEDVLFILDDDGTGHRLSIGLRAVKELSQRGYRPFILTGTAAVARVATEAGFAVARLPSVPNGAENALALYTSRGITPALQELARTHGPGSPEWIFVHTILPRILSYARSSAVAESILNEISATGQPICFFSMNDSRFLPKVAARWGTARGYRCEVFDAGAEETDGPVSGARREQNCWSHFDRMFPTSRGELLYLTATPAQMARARQHLTPLLAGEGNDVRAVSFYYPTETNLRDISRLVSWRGALSFSEETVLMEDSYRRFDKLLNGLSEANRALLWPLYHESVRLLFEGRTLLHFLESSTDQHCLVVSGDCGETRAYEGLALSRKLLVDSLPNPPLNPWSYEQLLKRQLAERHSALPVFDQEAAAEGERGTHESVWKRGVTQLNGEDIIFVVDDGGTTNFLHTGLSVMKELAARGHRPFVMTSRGSAAKAVMNAGLPVARVPVFANGREYTVALERTISVVAALREAAQSHGPGTPEWIFIHTMIPRVLALVREQVIAESMLDEIGSLTRPTCIFSINEGFFLPMVAGRWGRARGLTWIGYINVLISDHPESKFFPADQHLIYGEQGAELLVEAGAAPQTVHAIGSELFEKGLGRSLEADRRAMETLVPAIRGRKLVVVGSENRAEQMEEIQAILQELTPMQDLHVVLKLHPDDPEEPFHQMASRLTHRDNLTVIPRCDLHALLNAADLLICVRSNIIIEAAVMGTPTLVCDFNAELARINMVEEGIALGCWRREDVAAKTRACLFDEETIRTHREITRRGLARFNGPNDGNSCSRVVDFILEWRRRVLAGNQASAA